jgi:O-antigen/teichoic acid export membrane protein
MTADTAPQAPRDAEAPTGASPRPLTGGALMTGGSRVLAAAAAAAAGIFVARLLGPSGTGKYAVAQTLIALLTVATTLGVEHGIAYYVSSGRWAARDAYRSSQRVALVSGLLGGALGVLARVAIPSAFGGLSVVMSAVTAFALPFALSWYYMSFVALALDRYGAFVLPPALQATLMLCLVCILGALFGLTGAVAGLALSHVLTALPSAVLGRTLLGTASAGARGTERNPGNDHALRRAVVFGVKGYAANALQFINYRLDMFILASVATSAAVGHYAVAVAVTGVLWLLPQAISEVLFPRVAALSASGAEAVQAMREMAEIKSLRHATLIVLVSTAALALASLLLIVPIYGAAFRSAVDLALILLPGVAALGLTGPMAATIVGRGHPGYSLAITLIVTPLTVGLYIALIPPLHATGAALGSSISYLSSSGLIAVFYTRLTGRPALRLMIPGGSELEDYRRLAGGARARIAASRRRIARPHTWTRAR